ncbi:MAG: hypothetical protein AAFQ89_19860 [Cyanobacteria bacterium J06626_18]
MSRTPSSFQPEELRRWQFGLKQADDNNVFCHCRVCDREWVASSHEVRCICGSNNVETISCWQFPDG